VIDALVAEAAALQKALSGLPAPEWERPTRCPPWTVSDLLGHVVQAVGRTPQMLAAPAPPRSATLVTAAGYYRPDERFSSSATAGRIMSAQEVAAGRSGAAVLAGFSATVAETARSSRVAGPDRLVRTRHGDPMLLTEFLATRVVETAVHGLDLADALDRPAWLTTEAAAVIEDLLLGPGRHAPSAERFIRAATGRGPDPELLARLRPRRLTLG